MTRAQDGRRRSIGGLEPETSPGATRPRLQDEPAKASPPADSTIAGLILGALAGLFAGVLTAAVFGLPALVVIAATLLWMGGLSAVGGFLSAGLAAGRRREEDLGALLDEAGLESVPTESPDDRTGPSRA